MSTKHILALLNAHIDGEEDQLLSIALQLAAQEARQGRVEDTEKHKRRVQKALDQHHTGKPVSGQTPIPLARPRGELQAFVESFGGIRQPEIIGQTHRLVLGCITQNLAGITGPRTILHLHLSIRHAG